MTPAYEKVLDTGIGLPAAAEGAPEAALSINVIYTSSGSTVAALKSAGVLASKLRARIQLLVAQVVPYPLPLESPPVLLDFSERRFRTIARHSPVETIVRLYLCREAAETLLTVLEPRSLIVMGGRKRWWPTRESRLARELRKAGHEVVFTETE